MKNKELKNLKDVIIELLKIDYVKIILILRPFVSYYIGGSIATNVKMRKDSKPKNIKEISIPPESILNYDEIDEAKILAKSLATDVLYFAKTLSKSIEKCNLTNLYNNLNSLTVVESDLLKQKLKINSKVIGLYNTEKNKIYVKKGDVTKSVYHELMHMASSLYINDTIYSGFSQNNMIGVGLTEGYTELLTQRYFSKETLKNSSYHLEMIFCKYLEKIVGKEKMENLYFNANLPGLINELKQYSNEHEIMEFISNVDFINKYLHNSSYFITINRERMISDRLKNIDKFLISSYAEKIKQKTIILSNLATKNINKISNKDLLKGLKFPKEYSEIAYELNSYSINKKISSYVNEININSVVKINKKVYDFRLNETEIEDIIKNIFKEDAIEINIQKQLY